MTHCKLFSSFDFFCLFDTFVFALQKMTFQPKLYFKNKNQDFNDSLKGKYIEAQASKVWILDYNRFHPIQPIFGCFHSFAGKRENIQMD